MKDMEVRETQFMLSFVEKLIDFCHAHGRDLPKMKYTVKIEDGPHGEEIIHFSTERYGIKSVGLIKRFRAPLGEPLKVDPEWVADLTHADWTPREFDPEKEEGYLAQQLLAMDVTGLLPTRKIVKFFMDPDGHEIKRETILQARNLEVVQDECMWRRGKAGAVYSRAKESRGQLEAG
jgi:hypothetical protein